MDRATWDAKVQRVSGHWYQSWPWGEVFHSQGWEVERVLIDSPAGHALAQVLFKHRGPLSYAYVPGGPALSPGAAPAFAQLLAAIDDLCRRHRAINLHLEPQQALPSSFTHTLVAAPSWLLPRRTLRVPLLEDQALLAQMRRNTAYAVRLAGRRGVTIEQRELSTPCITMLYEMLQQTARRQGFQPAPLSYYAALAQQFVDDAVLLVARSPSGIAAVQLVVAFGSMAINVAGASTPEHRSGGATAALTFEAMRWARAHGCQWYDHDGLLGEDDDPHEPGLDWFKLGFGGVVIDYPPALEHHYRPGLVRLWQLQHRLYN